MRGALILTHPTERFSVDEEQVLEYLEENSSEYDDIFYIASEYDPSPADSFNTFFPNEENRSDLPPGFQEGFYKRGLKESEERTGKLAEEEIEELKKYDTIEIGGGWRDTCVSNTHQTLPEEPEADILDSISYAS